MAHGGGEDLLHARAGVGPACVDDMLGEVGVVLVRRTGRHDGWWFDDRLKRCRVNWVLLGRALYGGMQWIGNVMKRIGEE